MAIQPQIKPIQIRSSVIAREIANSASTQTERYLDAFLKRAVRQVDTKRGMKEMHERLAYGAQQEIIRAYNASGIGGGKPYRQNETSPKLKRYAGGAMKRALSSPGFYSTTGSEIRLIDRSLLDGAAKQWYRLNFGAAPAGSNSPGVGSMSFFGRASRSRVSLEDYKPSARFRVPMSGLGVWSGDHFGTSTDGPIRPRRGGTALYIVTTGMILRSKGKDQVVGDGRQRLRGVFKPVWSQGIVGARFLDAGPRYLNENYPREFTAIVKGWIASSKAAGKL